jgi:hypothetical protein
LEVQKQQDEGVGYVYAKDRAKDPKSIPGEHWRVKFQSAGDLKKHGNTEKSKINEASLRYDQDAEAKAAAEEIFKQFHHWNFVSALKRSNGDINRAARYVALAGTMMWNDKNISQIIPSDTFGAVVKKSYQLIKSAFSVKQRNVYLNLYVLSKREIEEIVELAQKTIKEESVSKRDINSVIRELVDEMWVDTGTFSSDDEIAPGGDNQSGGEKQLKPTGRATEPGADANLVDLYKGSGGQSDTSALPSVGGAMSELQDLVEGKKNMNDKAKFLKNIIRETIEEVRGELPDYLAEPQEQKNMKTMLRIQSYATWGINNVQKQPKKMADVFNRIIMENDALITLQKKGDFDLDSDGIKSLKTIEAYAHWGANNLQSPPNKLVMILQRIIKQISEVIETYTQGFPSKVGQPIHEVSYETPSTTDATAAADHAYQERQEVLAMKRIQAYAHWGQKHATTHPKEVVGMFKKIADEIDGLVKAHEKGKEVSPSNVKASGISEVAPPGWEGTVKAMKKHSVGGAKRWNPKKKKDESVVTEGPCEDWPACGHGKDRYGNPDCPDSQGRFSCAGGCGRKIPKGASSSICPSCQRRMADLDREDPTGQDFEREFGGEYQMQEKKTKKKKITNPYALAWWMKNKGYESHK